MGVTSRDNQGNIQYDASQILQKISIKVPKSSYCMVGATMYDIYPREEWNYVFGLADMMARSGVFSFARYDPTFYGQPKPEPEVFRSRLLLSVVKVLTHEIGHLFGLKHCIYFSCALNGSNHYEEA